jgi:hypothetical protein
LAHQAAYTQITVEKAQKRTGTFSDETNRPFLKFVRAERLNDQAPPEGLWFEDMLRVGIIGQSGQRLDNRELSEKR